MVIVFALVAAVLVAAILLNYRLSGRDCKLVMPGTYSVYCDKGTYTCWYFWRWKSKNMETSQHPITVSITDEHHNAVPIDTSVGGEHELLEDDRSGERQFIFHALEPGHLEVKCDDKCVLVIVPTGLETYFWGSTLDFIGSGDDWNFLPVH